jgi:hypothetical protein
LAAAAPPPSAAQALSPSVLALYPAQAGELVFVDLQTARRSPHYFQLKAQVLPERFRQLEALAAQLGVDFDRNVERLSWGFVSTGDAARSDFMGVAEGSFSLRDVQRAAARQKLATAALRGAQAFVVGENKEGKAFVFAFRDNATCLFGFREAVEAMLARAAEGGESLLANPALTAQIEEVNRRAAVWMVLNGEFTQLGVRQFLGDATEIPGVETIVGRVQSANVRLVLDRGLDSEIAARCATPADAVWFSTLLSGAIYFQRQRLNESNPTLARVLADAKLDRTDDRISLALSVPESDLASLIQSKSFALRF